MSNHKRIPAILATALACACAPAAAIAKPVAAELRVEGRNGAALDSGTVYKTDTFKAKSSNRCGPITKNKQTLSGPNAMGLVGDAAEDNRKLDPFRVSDTFGFGLIVCEIGKFGSFNSSQAWLYRVNHEAPEVAADQFRVRRNDEVLWYFANFKSGQNTGDELELKAPKRVGAGQSFEVRVHAFNSAGKRTPAAGVKIGGGSFGTTDAAGRATGTISPARGFANLRATRGTAIPAAPVSVCERGGQRCP